MIYLDYNATTPVDQGVAKALIPFIFQHFGNPSSSHAYGHAAKVAVENARGQVATLLNCSPNEILFTSGGSESNNTALKGVAWHLKDKGNHIITSEIEHPAVLNVCAWLSTQGFEITYLPVDTFGQVKPDDLAAALTDRTILVSIMHANNETVIFPVEKVAALTATKGIPLHVDAVQTTGKVRDASGHSPLNLDDVPVDLLTASAHKFHGPKGVGILYLRRGTRLRSQVLGGHQERNLRAGTENVAGIVGAGLALELAMRHLDADSARAAALRDRLEDGICSRISIARVNGDRAGRIPNTTNIGFEALQAEAILMLLSNHGVCASSGSACSSGSLEPSHVLAAMGIDRRVVHGAIRFSLSRFTTEAEIDQVLDLMPGIIERLQKMQR